LLASQFSVYLKPFSSLFPGRRSSRKEVFTLVQVRELVKKQLNGYVARPEVNEDIDKYIVPSTFGDNAGIIGALTLAKMAYEGKRM